MAVRVRNLTTSTIFLPEPIEGSIKPREDKVFPYVEFDAAVNDARIAKIVSSRKIEIFSEDPLATASGGGNFSVGEVPPTNPISGDLWYNSATGWNALMNWDASRGKWLSVSEYPVGLGRDDADGNLLLGYGIVTAASNGTGVLLPRDAVIKRVSALAASGNQTKQVNLRVNGASVFSFSLVTREYTNNTMNLDLAEGDELWAEADTAGASATDIVIVMWISWRI